ncbi:MAG TPA: glutamate racemase [Chitinophagaceae bacterium]|nr:glutamate racemase [Chitinophagaceae bacterium]
MGKGSIGIFDSGYGGLTVLKDIVTLLPNYNYIYLGDNARSPYGSKSFDIIYEYTKEAVEWLFNHNCNLVILACNTASAKALRKLQQEWLPIYYPNKKLLGVIRPTAELIGTKTNNKTLGILGTKGTIKSCSYIKEIQNFFPEVAIYQQACPLWVPFIEEGLIENHTLKEIIITDLQLLFNQNKDIQTVLLACTHYPLIKNLLEDATEGKIKFISQGPIVACSLKKYLERHSKLDKSLSKDGEQYFYTTDNASSFEKRASLFYGKNIKAQKIKIALS